MLVTTNKQLMAKGDFGNKRNTNGLDKNPDNINKSGRPISIKNQLKELLAKNGELPISSDTFLRMITNKKDGKEYYLFKIPTQDALALKLISLAMSKNTNGFNALKLLLETFDGKANQPIENKIPITITGVEIVKD